MKRIVIPIVIIGIVIILVLYFKRLEITDDVSLIYNQTPDNYYDITVNISRMDASDCKEHLDRLKEQLPSYIEMILIISDDGFTECFSIKYAVKREELLKYYYKDSKEYKIIVNNLIQKGFLTEKEAGGLIGDGITKY